MNPFSLFGSLYDQECVSGFLPLTPRWASGPQQFVSLAEVSEFARAVIQQQQGFDKNMMGSLAGTTFRTLSSRF
ncbi:hypothetical protein Q9233_008209 [Columba guinea]|nr:hypothetical protein Q9233_008209 [Columba guinea]